MHADDDADRLADRVATAVDSLGALAEQGVALGPLTTYRVGGPAAVFVRARTRDDLVRVGAAGQVSGLDVLPIGRGSNMLIADAGFDGIAVTLVDLADTLDIDRSGSVVTASAGLSLPVVARKTAAAGLTGFEWAVGVPGSIGGAVRMNAGGHGSDMEASLIDVTIVDLAETGERTGERTVAASDIGLSFRHSELAESAVVVEARLQLAPGDRRESERMISEIVSWRRANQPGGQNAGSVFVNPVPGEVSAGALIDASGLRGLRVGSAHVSDKHANFIQVDDDGSADDVHALMQIVRDRVESASGYVLRSEIRLVGFGEAGH
ncbi:MAG TPA: UDP-N-acetylmuramate dehydrogenase [Ilumatobacteraceae bacterium]|nr:UDP-N-acetylmuramate dehydrogenase [Ilumatobacteraceae bacterium]